MLEEHFWQIFRNWCFRTSETWKGFETPLADSDKPKNKAPIATVYPSLSPGGWHNHYNNFKLNNLPVPQTDSFQKTAMYNLFVNLFNSIIIVVNEKIIPSLSHPYLSLKIQNTSTDAFYKYEPFIRGMPFKTAGSATQLWHSWTKGVYAELSEDIFKCPRVSHPQTQSLAPLLQKPRWSHQQEISQVHVFVHWEFHLRLVKIPNPPDTRYPSFPGTELEMKHLRQTPNIDNSCSNSF